METITPELEKQLKQTIDTSYNLAIDHAIDMVKRFYDDDKSKELIQKLKNLQTKK